MAKKKNATQSFLSKLVPETASHHFFFILKGKVNFFFLLSFILGSSRLCLLRANWFSSLCASREKVILEPQNVYTSVRFSILIFVYFLRFVCAGLLFIFKSISKISRLNFVELHVRSL